jgi:uncharacterized membrane-anchored protein
MTHPLTHTQIHLLVRAKAAGLLPQDAEWPAASTERPWPVVLLTALGAWLAAVPLLGVVGMLIGDFITRSGGAYLVALLVLAAALVLLRARDLPLFVEQLAVPALLVGGGSLGFGLFRDLPFQAAAALLAGVALVLAAALGQPWLRVLLGALAAGLTQSALASGQGDLDALFARHGAGRLWFAVQAELAVWLGLLWAQSHAALAGGRPRVAAALESIGAGWLLATLIALAWLSGLSFLVGGSLGGMGGEMAGALAHGRGAAAMSWVMPLGSVLAALAAAGWAARTWPQLRALPVLAVFVVLIGLAWFLTSLGAVWLALAVCATTQRWRLAAACALAAAWVLGSFYYQLAWPLAGKALVLVAAGALLGVLAWLGWRGKLLPPRAGGAQRATGRPGLATLSRGLIALALVATLAVVNAGIFQKERLIAEGRPVFVELAPVDPRSLMQGDYMRLNFRLPADVQQGLDGLLTTRSRPQVVARQDARGVATLLRIDVPGEALGSDEMRIELTPKGGRWILVSDAWFFRVGDAARWSGARYGEFRVAGDGRALLVGMADAGLRRIEP